MIFFCCPSMPHRLFVAPSFIHIRSLTIRITSISFILYRNGSDLEQHSLGNQQLGLRIRIRDKTDFLVVMIKIWHLSHRRPEMLLWIIFPSYKLEARAC
ncbi:unnamed protein product [Cuscuta epithymum]|uniref:Uncharacterized protein n=1 Tax=Cuscuta epithymum TaxID=186058 RepID=A0AAV0GB38_9ASTE|nr:unnamed protein product [Cuscuta epithymum]